jgi:hypothetical protein
MESLPPGGTISPTTIAYWRKLLMAMRHISPSSELVRCFTYALALRRRKKGKPAARRGRKAHGSLF